MSKFWNAALADILDTSKILDAGGILDTGELLDTGDNPWFLDEFKKAKKAGYPYSFEEFKRNGGCLLVNFEKTFEGGDAEDSFSNRTFQSQSYLSVLEEEKRLVFDLVFELYGLAEEDYERIQAIQSVSISFESSILSKNYYLSNPNDEQNHGYGEQDLDLLWLREEDKPSDSSMQKALKSHKFKGKTCYTFIDGGKDSFIERRKEGYSTDKYTKPYYYSDTAMLTQKETNTNKRFFIFTESPNIVDKFGICLFQVIIVATNYKQSQKDKILLYFNWGSYLKPPITYDSELSPLHKINPLDLDSIQFSHGSYISKSLLASLEASYPEYRFYGKKSLVRLK